MLYAFFPRCIHDVILKLCYRVMWSTVSVLGEVEGRGPFPRVLCMENPQTRVLLNSSFSAARGLLQRNVLVASWLVLKFSTRTGSTRYVVVHGSSSLCICFTETGNPLQNYIKVCICQGCSDEILPSALLEISNTFD